MKHYIGADLGGMSMKIGVVDENYNIIATAKRATNVEGGPRAIADDMVRTIQEAVEKSGLSLTDMAWCGVGTPGTVNKRRGVVEYANNLKFDNVPLASYLKEGLGLDVYMENDANAAAYGETLAGAGKGYENVVCVTLGTGVGSGIILEGRIFSGSNFAGGELGHTVIVKDGAPCTCGRLGCLEAYASATGLIRLTREAMQRHPGSTMWGLCAGKLENVDGRTAFDGMRAGDATAKAVVESYIGYLGCGLVNIVNTFQPELLCLGGGISKEGDTLLIPLREYVERESYTTKHSECRTQLAIAKLGNDAGIIGAAMLGRLNERQS